MKKSLLLLTTILSFNAHVVFAVDESAVGLDASPTVVSSSQSSSRVAASAADLAKIKAHILGYGSALGLPNSVEVVGSSGCCACLSTTFKAAEEFLLKQLAGQLLTHFLALALDDFSDGKMDGIADGKKISYAQEIAGMLGIAVSEEDLKVAPIDPSLLGRLVGLGTEVARLISEHGSTKDGLMNAAEAFAKSKMDKARKSLAVALIQETDRLIKLELGNGIIDGLGVNGAAINWKAEMKKSIEIALSRVVGSM